MKSNNGLYDYLIKTEILQTGTPEEILQAKLVYRKKYKSNWRKEQRQKFKEFTISFKKGELALITEQAKKYNRSRTKYIHDAIIAFSNKEVLIPDQLTINLIRQDLMILYMAVRKIELTDRVTAQELILRIEETEKKDIESTM